MSNASVTEQDRLLAAAPNILLHNYKQAPMVLDHGQGCELWDVAGRRFLDLTGGIAACPLGHAHPKLVAAIAAQAGRMIHVSNLYYNEANLRLAEKLVAEATAAGMESPATFFCNSGAEANEAAIKLAKRWQTVVKGRGERMTVLGFEGSFHGRTIATVALTGQEKHRTGFGPLVEWASFLPWPDSATDAKVLDKITESTCAVILEPIQAEGGIRIPPPGFLAALRKRCTETGTVLIFDEVQTGVGRTGTFFGWQQEGVVPDIASMAKGLGGGVPIGAIVAARALADGFAPGSHASTFGGNPLAAAAALAVLETIESDKLLPRVKAAGERLDRAFKDMIARGVPHAKESRGQGLLRGLLVDGDATPFVAKAREKGVLLSVAGGTVVRFVPPLIVTDAQLDEGLAALEAALRS